MRISIFMNEKLVKKYYSEQGIREWRRLVGDPYRRLEFDTTMHFIRKYLPKKKGLVLDAGGVPSRYTIEFGKLGFDVTLLDLSSEMLEIAKSHIERSPVKKRVRKIIQGSIDDLSIFENETFDAVACLGGPLSHVVDEVRREKGIDELIRVAKKGVPIFVSVIRKTGTLGHAVSRLS
jgi:ubiquinone/menaquinone biosynthesis C-methylase UbiE